MNTPIVDFVKRYAASEALRLHMPGHKGAGSLGVESLDLTEIEGADVLYHEDGILRESQRNATALFGTKKTVYSAEGSSLAIRAMLYLAKLAGNGNCILAARNAHKTFMTAAALLDLDVQWLYSSGSLLSCPISTQDLESALQKTKPIAVYITSPDYLGNVADIQGLAEVCHRYGTYLLVDNAHGAYLHFLDRHPMDLGADLCCDSAHKTLPVLTGGAYDMSGDAGADCGGAAPNNEQGWGRVDVGQSLYPTNGAVKLADRIPFIQGETYTMRITTTNAAPLAVQLAWIDYPGALGAEQALVNDLDLVVSNETTGAVW